MLCWLSRAAAGGQGGGQGDGARLHIQHHQHAQPGRLATADCMRPCASAEHIRRMLHLRRTAEVSSRIAYLCRGRV